MDTNSFSANPTINDSHRDLDPSPQMIYESRQLAQRLAAARNPSGGHSLWKKAS